MLRTKRSKKNVGHTNVSNHQLLTPVALFTFAVALVAAALVPAASAATTGVKLTQEPPKIYGAENGCSYTYNFIPTGSGPAYDYDRSVTVHGIHNILLGSLFHDYRFNDKGVFTATAKNPGDYFVDGKGNHVQSITYKRNAPVDVPAFCTDWPPVAPYYYPGITYPQTYTANVITDSKDRDNARRDLRLTIDTTQASKYGTITVVKDGNGFDAVKFTPNASGAAHGTGVHVGIDFTITDPLGKSSGGYISISLMY